MAFLLRIRLFVRDLLDELPVVWDLARMHDCERNGGHRYGPVEQDFAGSVMAHRTCSRCGTSELLPHTHGTGNGATNSADSYTIWR